MHARDHLHSDETERLLSAEVTLKWGVEGVLF